MEILRIVVAFKLSIGQPETENAVDPILRSYSFDWFKHINFTTIGSQLYNYYPPLVDCICNYVCFLFNRPGYFVLFHFNRDIISIEIYTVYVEQMACSVPFVNN